MSIVDIVAFVVAFAAAATKLLNAAKPFWSKLPTVVSTFLPSVVVMLPFLASKLSGVTTTVEFVDAVVVSLALLLPGAAAKIAK
jgi:hypothetical protein